MGTLSQDWELTLIDAYIHWLFEYVIALLIARVVSVLNYKTAPIHPVEQSQTIFHITLYAHAVKACILQLKLGHPAVCLSLVHSHAYDL